MRRLLLLLPLALAACGGDQPSAAPAPTTAAPIAERVFGFVPALREEEGRISLELDEATWLSGDAADRAAEEAGEIEPGEGVPNDYFIVNDDEAVRAVPVATGATAAVVARECCDLVELGSVAQWVEWYRASEPHGFGGPGGSWWLTIEDGAVVRIEEQYRP